MILVMRMIMSMIEEHLDLLELDDELDLKKLPMKLKSRHTPKACQNVNANATPNRLSTQFTNNMKSQPSKHIKANTIAITTNTAKNVPISINSSLSFTIIIIPNFY